ncbi:MAG: transketolase [Propionibacteriales bacterium]|nr:transketolase [Propionibacteriales bacterium]
MREQFAVTVTDILEDDLSTALVLADVSARFFPEATRRHPDRVINVGIREQLLVSAGAGLAFTGMRPIVHTFGAFLVERAFEQIKLDFDHQDVGGVLIGSGGSYDWPAGGRTHMSPGDVALIDTLRGWTVHVPGHAAEADVLIRDAVAGSGRVYVRLAGDDNAAARRVGSGRTGRFDVVRRGARASVVAVGPMLDPVLKATAGLDVTVLYAATVRPFDRSTLRETLAEPDVVLVEPYLAGTSTREVADALQDLPHRTLALGVGTPDLRRYGEPHEHSHAHGLDAAGLRESIGAFLDVPSRAA